MSWGIVKDGEVIGEITGVEISDYILRGQANVGCECVVVDMMSDLSVDVQQYENIDGYLEFDSLQSFINHNLAIKALAAFMVRYVAWEHCYDLCPMPDGVEVIERCQDKTC